VLSMTNLLGKMMAGRNYCFQTTADDSLLNGYPLGNGRWLLNRGSCILTIFHHQVNCTVNLYVKMIILSMCLNSNFYQFYFGLLFVKTKSFYVVLNFVCLLNRGKDNRKTLIGTTKRWPEMEVAG